MGDTGTGYLAVCRKFVDVSLDRMCRPAARETGYRENVYERGEGDEEKKYDGKTDGTR